MGHIIIADDDEIVRELAKRALNAWGHSVGAVCNGREAIRAVWAKKPDLLVLDCTMPVLSGILALRELRKSKEFFALPVVMLTARSSVEDERLAILDGADDYVRKPFDPDELAFRVETVLEKHAANKTASGYATGAVANYGEASWGNAAGIMSRQR